VLHTQQTVKDIQLQRKLTFNTTKTLFNEQPRT